MPSASVSYQYDGRGGYSKTIEKPRKEMIKEGMQHLKGEFGVLKDEVMYPCIFYVKKKPYEIGQMHFLNLMVVLLRFHTLLENLIFQLS